MTSNEFLNESVAKNLIKAEKIVADQVEKVIKSAEKNLMVSEKLLSIDEGHAYETAYEAMLYSARAFVFVKGYRPTTSFQHKTVVGFTAFFLGHEYKALIEKFDYMRKNRNNFIYEPWKVNISIEIIKEVIKKEHPQQHFSFKLKNKVDER